ncbi:hypothetical protein GS464_20245 [Rhodococcus hoagii]|nr:hypothetical protein [Prescottella equi]MBM4644793.1 hypothetical protein [Prescottella equi]
MGYRFQNISSNSSQKAITNQVNRALSVLDREAVVKQFNGESGEKLTIGKTGTDTVGMSVNNGDISMMNFGKYRSNRYGLLLYDANGVPNTLIGQAPDDGRMGVWVANPGQNVLTLLGG